MLCQSADESVSVNNILIRRRIVMTDIKKQTRYSIWRNGYFFALFALLIVGVLLIIIGNGLYDSTSLTGQVLIGIGISLGPAAIVGALFRVFLFREVQYELTSPIINELKQGFKPEVENLIEEIAEGYRRELRALVAMKKAGIKYPFRNRKCALQEFLSYIQKEDHEIMVVGSSLKGLLQNPDYHEAAELLKKKAEGSHGIVKFLLTHPVVADFRANQESRSRTEIGNEIIKSIGILKQWDVPVCNVRLYKGTPTCFGIRTAEAMILNPYPYGSVAYDTPSLIVVAIDGNSGYFYNAFDQTHFRTPWDTKVAEEMKNYDEKIEELKSKLETYAEKTKAILHLGESQID
jgi:hypothetical protein